MKKEYPPKVPCSYDPEKGVGHTILPFGGTDRCHIKDCSDCGELVKVDTRSGIARWYQLCKIHQGRFTIVDRRNA